MSQLQGYGYSKEGWTELLNKLSNIGYILGRDAYHMYRDKTALRQISFGEKIRAHGADSSVESKKFYFERTAEFYKQTLRQSGFDNSQRSEDKIGRFESNPDNETRHL